MEFLLRKVADGSLERLGTILRLEYKDDKTVTGVTRALVTQWLDRFDSERPASTVENAITQLAVRVIDSYTKRQTELAERIRAETKQSAEQHLAEMERMDTLTKEMEEDAQRMREAHARFDAAKTPQEKDDAFAAMMKALAGTTAAG